MIPGAAKHKSHDIRAVRIGWEYSKNSLIASTYTIFLLIVVSWQWASILQSAAAAQEAGSLEPIRCPT